MDKTVLSQIQFFNTNFLKPKNKLSLSGNLYKILQRTIHKSLKEQYGSNPTASWSEFARNIGKISSSNFSQFASDR